MRQSLVWAPQPGPQTALVHCPISEILFGGARGGGKCLPLTEPVLTPFGWRNLGDIAPGQQVCNPNGSVSRVLATYRPGVAKVYRLTFSDGAQAVCDDGHIWLGSFVGGHIKRDLNDKLWTFAEIRRRYAESKDARFLIPLCAPVVFTRPSVTRHGNRLPVDGYLLGVLLGDGCLTGDSVRYATTDDEIDAAMARWGTVRVDDGPNRRLVNCPDVLAGLRQLAVWGKVATEKFVPEAYLWASEDVRWSVLQGLMDTDGTADSRGQCYFSSCSRRLSEDVQFLARSLGFKATLTTKETTHLPAHMVYIRGPNREKLFRLARKVERASQDYQAYHSVRRLVSIEEAGIAEVGCFQVDDPNGLFITRDFVVTHNTDGVLGKFALKQARLGAKFNAIFFRQEMPQADDLIERAKQIYLPLGAVFRGHPQPQFDFPGGGRLRFRPLATVDDAAKYQGQNLSDAAVEEAGNYPLPDPIDRLWGALRGGRPQLILTANPGGAGQSWITNRFVAPWPAGRRIIRTRLPNGNPHERIYLPSRVSDNTILLRDDPQYVDRLYLVGSKELVRAWLDGDWTAVEGAFFDCWSMARHVIPAFQMPGHWTRFRSFDWGSASPFSVGWWCVVGDDTTLDDGRVLPRGAIIRYREWYGASRPNVGLKITNREIARGIIERERGDDVTYGVADPSIFANKGGPSIADEMRQEGVNWRPADNTRVGPIGHASGWSLVRQRLVGFGHNAPPMMFVFDTCRDFIRTMPVLTHDRSKNEDIDTDQEDHIADEVRYACASRPWSPPLSAKTIVRPRDGYSSRRNEAETEASWKTL